MEELKLILEALQGVSGDAKTVVILWLAKGYLSTIFVFGGVLVALRVLYLLINKGIQVASFTGRIATILDRESLNVSLKENIIELVRKHKTELRK